MYIQNNRRKRKYSDLLSEEIGSPAGFTMAELIVAIAIIGLLTAMFLANYRAGGEESGIRMVAREMAGEIRRAQSNTLGAVKYEDEVPEGGWGVHITEDSEEYILYADVNADREYNEPDEEWRTETLPEGFSVTSVEGSSEADIVFEPPAPITYINGDDRDKITITVADTKGNSADIRVNFFGMIEVIE